MAKASPDHTSPASRYVSPMPGLEDRFGPRFVPFRQTLLAALAAVTAVGFALLLYLKL